MTRTQTLLLLGAALVLIAATAAVKLVFFPPISDKYFTVSQTRLKQVPAGFVVIRPTHFGGSAHREQQNRFVETTSKTGGLRLLGVNVTFQMLIAAAYNQNPGRISLPWDAPTNCFDILVTANGDPQELLKGAIRQKLGYSAQTETKDTPVLDLKVTNPNPSGLKTSSSDEKQNVEYKNGRLYFTHTRLDEITSGMEQMLRTPVVDKTGLTNFYDFSLAWNQRMQQAMQGGNIDPATGKKILGDWGLGLEPDTAPMEMLVVERAK